MHDMRENLYNLNFSPSVVLNSYRPSVCELQSGRSADPIWLPSEALKRLLGVDAYSPLPSSFSLSDGPNMHHC